MNKYKSLIVSSLVISAIVLAPVTSFADNNGTGNQKVRAEESFGIKKDSSKSLLSRVFGIFDKKKIENSNLTPSILSVKAPTVLDVGETGTWEVKAKDPQNGSLEYAVDWGEINSLSGSKMAINFTQTSTFTHSYSEKGKYTITFTVINDAGLKTTSSVTVHVGGQVVSSVPVISNLNVTSIKSHKATLTWNTDVKSNSLVWFSKTSPIDNSIKANISRKAKVLNHKIELNKLEPNTKYYIIVGSANGSGTGISTETSFTTLAKNNDTPVITSLSGPSTILVGDTEKITVNAYDPKNGTLSYGVDWGDTDTTSLSSLKDREPLFVQSATFSHVYSKAGTYTATFTVQNDRGQKTSSSIKVTVLSTATSSSTSN